MENDQTNAMLDIRRVVGMLAAKMGSDPAHWREAAGRHSLEYLAGEFGIAWQRVSDQQLTNRMEEWPSTPPEAV